MPATQLTHHSPYTARQMYDLVADVEQYAEFLPYCTASRVLNIKEQTDGRLLMHAELTISYKFLREIYMSAVLLDPQALTISVNKVPNSPGPLRILDNHWAFTDLPSHNTQTEGVHNGGSQVMFSLDFDFRLPFLRNMFNPLMGRAGEKLMQAFETRSHELYG